MAQLFIYPPVGMPFAVDLRADTPYTVGRQDSDITIPTDPALSRRHATLSHQNGAWLIDASASKRGVVIGNATFPTASLFGGDEFLLGRTRFLIEGEPSDEATPNASFVHANYEQLPFGPVVARSATRAGAGARRRARLSPRIVIWVIVAGILVCVPILYLLKIAYEHAPVPDVVKPFFSDKSESSPDRTPASNAAADESSGYSKR